jgi:hypothetical protein
MTDKISIAIATAGMLAALAALALLLWGTSNNNVFAARL